MCVVRRLAGAAVCEGAQIGGVGVFFGMCGRGVVAWSGLVGDDVSHGGKRDVRPRGLS